jgi:hypothetical protein
LDALTKNISFSVFSIIIQKPRFRKTLTRATTLNNLQNAVNAGTYCAGEPSLTAQKQKCSLIALNGAGEIMTGG